LSEIEKLRQNKNKTNGSFDNHIFLSSVDWRCMHTSTMP
jgi:hypothetical protein